MSKGSTTVDVLGTDTISDTWYNVQVRMVNARNITLVRLVKEY
jgi:hypothetical protein